MYLLVAKTYFEVCAKKFVSQTAQEMYGGATPWIGGTTPLINLCRLIFWLYAFCTELSVKMCWMSRIFIQLSWVLDGCRRLGSIVSWWRNIPYGIPVLIGKKRIQNHTKILVYWCMEHCYAKSSILIIHLILSVSFDRIVGLGTGLSLGEHVHPTLAPSAELVRDFSFWWWLHSLS